MRIDQTVEQGFETITGWLFGWTDRYPDNIVVKWIPNLLSISRFGILPLTWFFYQAIRHSNGARWVYFTAILLLALTDAIDGPLARRRKVVSTLGSVLDHVGDKLAIFAFLTCFIFLIDLSGALKGTLTALTCTVVVGAVFCAEVAIALVNMTHRTDWGSGATQKGRIKACLQAFSLLVGTIGLCTSYHDAQVLAAYIWVAIIGLAVSFVLARQSLDDYLSRTPVPPPSNPGPPPGSRSTYEEQQAA